MKAPLPILVGLMVVAPPAFGDLLELKNGQMLNGKYAGGTAGTMRFDTSAGQQVLPISQVIALTFTAPPAVAAAPQAARFSQIENQINLALDLRVAASLPLIK
jgi:hypothetical protein